MFCISKHNLRFNPYYPITPTLRSVYQKPTCPRALWKEASWSLSNTPRTTRMFTPRPQTRTTSPRLAHSTFVKTPARTSRISREPSTHERTPNTLLLTAQLKSLHVRSFWILQTSGPPELTMWRQTQDREDSTASIQDCTQPQCETLNQTIDRRER